MTVGSQLIRMFAACTALRKGRYRSLRLARLTATTYVVPPTTAISRLGRHRRSFNRHDTTECAIKTLWQVNHPSSVPFLVTIITNLICRDRVEPERHDTPPRRAAQTSRPPRTATAATRAPWGHVSPPWFAGRPPPPPPPTAAPRDPLRISDIVGAAAGTTPRSLAATRFARPSTSLDVSDIVGTRRGARRPFSANPAAAARDAAEWPLRCVPPGEL